MINNTVIVDLTITTFLCVAVTKTSSTWQHRSMGTINYDLVTGMYTVPV